MAEELGGGWEELGAGCTEKWEAEWVQSSV